MERTALLVLLALAVLLCAGCGARGDAIEIREWTLRAPSATRDEPVTLPAHVDRLVAADRPETFTLRARVALPEAWRGAPLTLVVPFHQAPVALSAGGA